MTTNGERDIDAELQTMVEAQIECRTFGHAWRPERTVSDRTGITIELACTRCQTGRIDSVDKGDGTIVARSYDYAAGYRGHGKVTRNIFRFEFVKRATGG